MADDKQIEWLERMGILKDAPVDRSQYEQQWPLPLAPDKSLHKPWYVASYSGAALGNVLRSDYGATYRDGVFTVDGGEMRRVYRSEDLFGARGGTLFVLYDPHVRSHSKLDRVLDVAHTRGIRIETLKDYRDATRE